MLKNYYLDSINMSSSYSPIVSNIFKSRNIILELLKKRGFSVDDYTEFSINEVHIMYNNKQLDMLLENPISGKKIYIKYHLATRLGNSHVYDYVDDLFDIEDIFILCCFSINNNIHNYYNSQTLIEITPNLVNDGTKL